MFESPGVALDLKNNYLIDGPRCGKGWIAQHLVWSSFCLAQLPRSQTPTHPTTSSPYTTLGNTCTPFLHLLMSLNISSCPSMLAVAVCLLSYIYIIQCLYLRLCIRPPGCHFVYSCLFVGDRHVSFSDRSLLRGSNTCEPRLNGNKEILSSLCY